jgi:hypothetical protein
MHTFVAAEVHSKSYFSISAEFSGVGRNPIWSILRIDAFTSPLPLCRKLNNVVSLASSKDEEIARLEEKLRQLRETDEQQQQQDEETMSKAVGVTVPNTLEEPFVEMLSESWREADPAENGESAGILAPLVGGILAIVMIAAFSQVPIGQEDYTKYSAVKTSTEVDLGDLNAVRIKAIQGL